MGLKPVGFPKPEIRGKGSFTPPPPKQLSTKCELGDYVRGFHGTEEICGILKYWNGDGHLEPGNEATILLGDGTEVVVSLSPRPS